MSVLGNTFTKTAAFGGGKRLSMAPKSPKATTVLGDVTNENAAPNSASKKGFGSSTPRQLNMPTKSPNRSKTPKSDSVQTPVAAKNTARSNATTPVAAKTPKSVLKAQTPKSARQYRAPMSSRGPTTPGAGHVRFVYDGEEGEGTYPARMRCSICDRPALVRRAN